MELRDAHTCIVRMYAAVPPVTEEFFRTSHELPPRMFRAPVVLLATRLDNTSVPFIFENALANFATVNTSASNPGFRYISMDIASCFAGHTPAISTR